MDYVNAFWVGGLICALCQILMEKTKMQPGRIMVLLVCSGAVLGSNRCISAFRGICRSGSIGAIVRLWQYAV